VQITRNDYHTYRFRAELDRHYAWLAQHYDYPDFRPLPHARPLRARGLFLARLDGETLDRAELSWCKLFGLQNSSLVAATLENCLLYQCYLSIQRARELLLKRCLLVDCSVEVDGHSNLLVYRSAFHNCTLRFFGRAAATLDHCRFRVEVEPVRRRSVLSQQRGRPPTPIKKSTSFPFSTTRTSRVRVFSIQIMPTKPPTTPLPKYRISHPTRNLTPPQKRPPILNRSHPSRNR